MRRLETRVALLFAVLIAVLAAMASPAAANPDDPASSSEQSYFDPHDQGVTTDVVTALVSASCAVGQLCTYR